MSGATVDVQQAAKVLQLTKLFGEPPKFGRIN
jgi:hypothetical protein